MTRTVLGDNARALVSGRDVATSTVHFQPAYLAFCRDWDVQPRACAPYRARTKGKTESGVKYVKRNAFAGLTLPSFVALETHLATWMPLADQRIHGTTHEAPAVRFARDEPPVLRPLPQRALPRREQRVRRRVAADALVDIDTVRCSVPHPLVREHVEVAIGDDTVRLYHGGQLVATHRRHERREAGACRRALAAVAPRISGRAARRRVGRHRAHRADVSRFLDQLLQQATAAKQRKRIAMGIQIAHFPTVKTLDDFDFKFQASIDQRLVRELATGRFISQAENVLIFGPPGRRQDALAFGLGRAAVESGHAVLFTSAAALSGALAESETDGQLAERFTFHSKPKLLIIGAAARTCSSSSWRAATSAAAR